MTEQQEPFGETDQMWVPAVAAPLTEAQLILSAVEQGLREIKRNIAAHLRSPEPAAIDWAVQHHSFIRNRAQLVRDLQAYADALERVILPAAKP